MKRIEEINKAKINYYSGIQGSHRNRFKDEIFTHM